jgi:pimeloyl-ACP methyl ester carboxylesterase
MRAGRLRSSTPCSTAGSPIASGGSTRPSWRRARKLDPRVYRETYNVFATAETGPWLADIKVPTLVMTGEFDMGCGPALNRKMAETIPQAQLKILPDLKHSILVEAPGTVADALKEFLRSVETSGLHT